MTDVLSLGAACVGLALAGALIGLVFGAATGFAVGWLGARPLLRWGLGKADLAGCLAIGVLVAFGGLGGLWAGLGGGAAWCAHEAVNQRFLLEDLAISAVVQVATEGRSRGTVEDDAEAIEALVETAGGSLEAILADIEAQILAEEPSAEVPEFLTPDVVPKLLQALDDHELFAPRAMAEVRAVGGVAAARGGDPRVAAYAERLVDAFAPVRREVWLGMLTAAVSNAVVTMLVTVPAPMVLIAIIALVARLIRRSGGGAAPPVRSAPPV
jgi:hypothetical protein